MERQAGDIAQLIEGSATVQDTLGLMLSMHVVAGDKEICSVRQILEKHLIRLSASSVLGSVP